MDKTGTITLGNRVATDFLAAGDVEVDELVRAALYSSLADDTPEGRSIVVLAKEHLGNPGQRNTRPRRFRFHSVQRRDAHEWHQLGHPGDTQGLV